LRKSDFGQTDFWQAKVKKKLKRQSGRSGNQPKASQGGTENQPIKGPANKLKNFLPRPKKIGSRINGACPFSHHPQDSSLIRSQFKEATPIHMA
jgi:hypothetical protein